MPYDNTCKFLAETFSRDLATWLLGEPLPLTKLEPSELSLEPIRADSVVLLESAQLVLHTEFQTDPDPDLPFRMADYRLRLYRRAPQQAVRQVVVYLRRSPSALVYQTQFAMGRMLHEYEVVRLWEQPVERFLQVPGLLPFAALSQTPDPEATLVQVAQQLDAMPNPRVQSNLQATAGILAGLVLEKEVIGRILRVDRMRESVIYQEIEAQGIQKGLQQGIQKGLQQGLQQERSLVLRLLTRKIGPIPPEVQSQVESLALTELEALGEALLEFGSLADLTAWLAQNS